MNVKAADVRCCDDCGDVVKRRTRCVECGSFTCRWCFHHNMHVGRSRTIEGFDAGVVA